MSKVFKNKICFNIEVYIEDMIVKTPDQRDHLADIWEIFQELKKPNMNIIPSKCVFGVEARKFVGFMITNKESDAKPTKC